MKVVLLEQVLKEVGEFISPAAEASDDAESRDEIRRLREAIATLQKRMREDQREIDAFIAEEGNHVNKSACKVFSATRETAQSCKPGFALDLEAPDAKMHPCDRLE